MSKQQSNLPPQWVETTLDAICSNIVDGSHNPPAKQDAGYPMLSARNIENGRIEFDVFRNISPEDFEVENARTQIKPGDVLLTIVGTIGRTAVVPESTTPFTLQRSVAVLKPIEVLPKFCMYQLQSPQTQSRLVAMAKGTAQKGVYLRSLGTLKFVLAPLAEQQRIVDEIDKQFSRLDSAVNGLRRTQSNLITLRAATLKSACEGRLVPTEAELARIEGRDYEAADRLLKSILHERRAKWESSYLAKVKDKNKSLTSSKWKDKYEEPVAADASDYTQLPEGWIYATVDQLSEAVQYGTSTKTDQDTQGVAVLRMGNINTHGQLVLDDLRYLPSDHKEFPELLLAPGDILFNRTNSAELVGKTAVYKGEPLLVVFQQFVKQFWSNRWHNLVVLSRLNG